MKKEKADLEKELVYKPVYLPVRFFKKEAYIHIDDYKEAINKRENVVNDLEEENKKLRDYADNLDSENDNQAIEIEELKKENKKLKDEFMLRLAEAYLLPPTSNQMAEYKQWNYSKWYDEIKNQMRKEIKEED